MKWFGANWGAPICEELEQVPIPVEERCFHCKGDFMNLDRGVVLPYHSAEGIQDTFWHLVCFKKTIFG